MRGKPTVFTIAEDTQRIIPARAGQTKPVDIHRFRPTDHPRACGANCVALRAAKTENGSSPRVRGKRIRLALPDAVGRIIPARAGQTPVPATPWAHLADHPRACGANPVNPIDGTRNIGSSPRVRGKRRRNSGMVCRTRIIPARAGQTRTPPAPYHRNPDHPRACGANEKALDNYANGNGSSPRVRGKLPDDELLRTIGRIIPARAGQTNRPPRIMLNSADHPRACGANEHVPWVVEIVDGSSPRVRGKRLACRGFLAFRRIIPARAGQTVRFYAKTLERWTLNNWIRTVAPIFVLLFLLPVIGQNAYIERHYSNQSFSWFSKLHYASAFDLSLVA